jgi:hypothetical protein
MLCKIIKSCSLLENTVIRNTFELACKEPILKALASRSHIKGIHHLEEHRQKEIQASVAGS